MSAGTNAERVDGGAGKLWVHCVQSAPTVAHDWHRVMFGDISLL